MKYVLKLGSGLKSTKICSVLHKRSIKLWPREAFFLNAAFKSPGILQPFNLNLAALPSAFVPNLNGGALNFIHRHNNILFLVP